MFTLLQKIVKHVAQFYYTLYLLLLFLKTIILQMGMYTLSIMTEMSHSSYIVHAESFAVLFTNTLNGLTQPNTNLGYYTVITMKNLVPIIGGHQQVCCHTLSNH